MIRSGTFRRVVALVGAVTLGLVTAGCGGDDAGDTATDANCAAYDKYGDHDGKTVSIYTSIRDVEADNYEKSWDEFERCTGVQIAYEGSGEFEAQLQVRVQGGNAPDLAFIPQPGLLERFAKAGQAKAAPAEVKTLADANYSADWLRYGTVDGTFYGAPMSSNVKSFVWYSPKMFKAKGWTVPTTWADLMKLSETIAA
ncbi:MAG TPA: ABC transporter substrate-binding protein, partial [Actinoplanes sp.]|nr:ABC transporter substrate-binding protein [Actinoplanes sp.]